MRDAGLLALAIVTVLVIVVAISSGGSDNHRVWVTIPDATGMLVGEPIRDAGITVGNVTYLSTINGGHDARVGLTVSSKAWPLRHGTIFHLRWGGTVSYLNDYVDLLIPAHGGADYADGANLPRSAFTVPVQFDTLIDDFTPSVRGDIKSLLNRGGAALGQAEGGLRDTLEKTPPALDQANALLGDLVNNAAQVKSTINSAADVVSAFQASQPTVEDLVSGAGQTLQAIADRATGLQQTLSRAPGTFQDIDTTLVTADRTLDLAGRVTHQIAPGVSQLKETVKPLDRLLENVMAVAPNARETLTTLANKAPRISAVVYKLNSLMPAINYTATHGNTELSCIRPYTPDIVALTTNWSRFLSSTDGTDFYARILPSAIISAPTNAQPETSQQAVQEDPGLTESFPRAPGSSADEPWYLPKCGITSANSDPADDPESNNSDDIPLAVINHPGNSK